MALDTGLTAIPEEGIAKHIEAAAPSRLMYKPSGDMSFFDQQPLDARTIRSKPTSTFGASGAFSHFCDAFVRFTTKFKYELRIQRVIENVDVIEDLRRTEEVGVNLERRTVSLVRQRSDDIQHRVHLAISPRIRWTAGQRAARQQNIQHQGHTGYKHRIHLRQPHHN